MSRPSRSGGVHVGAALGHAAPKFVQAGVIVHYFAASEMARAGLAFVVQANHLRVVDHQVRQTARARRREGWAGCSQACRQWGASPALAWFHRHRPKPDRPQLYWSRMGFNIVFHLFDDGAGAGGDDHPGGFGSGWRFRCPGRRCPPAAGWRCTASTLSASMRQPCTVHPPRKPEGHGGGVEIGGGDGGDGDHGFSPSTPRPATRPGWRRRPGQTRPPSWPVEMPNRLVPATANL